MLSFLSAQFATLRLAFRQIPVAANGVDGFFRRIYCAPALPHRNRQRLAVWQVIDDVFVSIGSVNVRSDRFTAAAAIDLLGQEGAGIGDLVAANNHWIMFLFSSRGFVAGR